VFDVLALNGEPTLRLPYVERYALLEEILLGDANGAEIVGLSRMGRRYGTLSWIAASRESLRSVRGSRTGRASGCG